jgi:CRP/FNR family nitrogen fixation transcriptional regulator
MAGGPFFSTLSETQISSLMKDSETISLSARNYLFHTRDRADAVYVINSGELAIERTTSDGARQIAMLLFPGNMAGFSSEKTYNYSVLALTQSSVSKVRLASMVDLADRSPNFRDKELDMLGNVLLSQVDHLFTLAKKKSHERLCSLLCELNRKQKSGQGRTVRLNLTRQDIADYLGLNPETVTRALKKLADDGIIALQSPRDIELLTPQRVYELAGELPEN